MKYYVILKIEEEFEVEADNEKEAVALAEQMFDPTAGDLEFVEIWSDEDD